MNRARKRGVGAAGLSLLAVVLAGCASGSGPQQLGSGSSATAQKGVVRLMQVFPGSSRQGSATISATALTAGGSYSDDNDGALTVKGPLPPNVTLTVPNGTLTVDGNVAAGDNLDAEAPVVTHDQTYGCYTTGFKISGKYGYGYIPNGCTETVTDGLRFNGPASILIVFGKVSPKAQLTSNGGISVNGKAKQNPNQLSVAPS